MAGVIRTPKKLINTSVLLHAGYLFCEQRGLTVCVPMCFLQVIKCCFTMLKCITVREGANMGIFLKEVLQLLMHWRSTEKVCGRGRGGGGRGRRRGD